MRVMVVFDVEAEAVPVPLGVFVARGLGSVLYQRGAVYQQAPEGSVRVVDVDVPTITELMELDGDDTAGTPDHNRRAAL